MIENDQDWYSDWVRGSSLNHTHWLGLSMSSCQQPGVRSTQPNMDGGSRGLRPLLLGRLGFHFWRKARWVSKPHGSLSEISRMRSPLHDEGEGGLGILVEGTASAKSWSGDESSTYWRGQEGHSLLRHFLQAPVSPCCLCQSTRTQSGFSACRLGPSVWEVFPAAPPCVRFPWLPGDRKDHPDKAGKGQNLPLPHHPVSPTRPSMPPKEPQLETQSQKKQKTATKHYSDQRP